MNKKIMTVAIAGSLAMSLSAFASSGPGASHHKGSSNDNMDWAQGWYIGAGVNGDAEGTMNLKGRDPSVFANGSNTAGGITAAPTKFDQTNRNIGFDVFVGRSVNDHFAFEMGYTWLGNVDFNSKNASDVKTDKIEIQQWNVHAVGVGKFPIGDYFAMYAKGGLAYMNVDQKTTRSVNTTAPVKNTEKLSTFALTAGAGLEVMWDQFGVRGEYNVMLPSDSARDDFYISDIIGLNAYYKFM